MVQRLYRQSKGGKESLPPFVMYSVIALRLNNVEGCGLADCQLIQVFNKLS